MDYTSGNNGSFLYLGSGAFSILSNVNVLLALSAGESETIEGTGIFLKVVKHAIVLALINPEIGSRIVAVLVGGRELNILDFLAPCILDVSDGQSLSLRSSVETAALRVSPNNESSSPDDDEVEEEEYDENDSDDCECELL